MVGRFPFCIAALCLAASVAGCVSTGPNIRSNEGPEGPGSVVAPPGAPEGMAPDLGSIEGTVLTDELQPIAGAIVAMFQPIELRATSDAEGRFAFVKLEPGTYAVQAMAEGYDSQARSFLVQAGTAAEGSFVLKSHITDEPYANLFIDGFFFSCVTVTGPVGLNACGLINGTVPLFPNDLQIARHDSDPNLVAVAATLAWNANQVLGARSMELSIYADHQKDQYFTSYKSGPSPLTNTTILESPMAAKNRINTGAFPNRFCGPSNPTACASSPPESLVQVVAQQRIAGYTTLFYGDLPPPGYTGLADG